MSLVTVEFENRNCHFYKCKCCCGRNTSFKKLFFDKAMFYRKSPFNKTKKNFSTRMHLCQWSCKHRLLFVLQIIRKGDSNTPNEKEGLHGLVIYPTKGDGRTQPMFTSLTALLHVWITSSQQFPKQFCWDVKSGKWCGNQQVNLVAGKEGRELF